MKKKQWIIFIGIVVIIETIMIVFSYRMDIDNEIPENYIAIFKSEAGEIVYTTYLYKNLKNKKIKYKYINKKTTLNEYNSTDFNEKIKKKGTLKNKNEIFKIAKKNNAYSYVKYMKEDKIYTIEEFKKKFK